MTVKYDISRVSRELLEAFVVGQCNLDGKWLSGDILSGLAADIRKSAEVPLRTRAEVDADIALMVRRYDEFKRAQHLDDESLFLSRAYSYKHGSIVTIDRDVKALLAEETSD